MSGTRRRPLLVALCTMIIIGIVVFAYFRMSGRFRVGDTNINPHRAVNPDRQYSIVLWEETIVVPWAEQTHAEMVDSAVAQFREMWPNADVTVVMVDKETGPEQLAAANAAGRPPDIYGAMDEIVLLGHHQIPVAPYVPTEGQRATSPFVPAAARAVTVHDVIVGWPRALWWYGWLADEAALSRGNGRSDELADRGWNGDAFFAWLDRLPDPPRTDHRPVTFDITDTLLLEQLLATAGTPLFGPPPPEIGASGSATFGTHALEEHLLEVGRFVQTLRAERYVLPDAEAMSRRRVQTLLSGTGSVSGPVTPLLAQTVLRRDANAFTIVHAPSFGTERLRIPVTAAGYYVFRQAVYEGDDHTRLVMELVQFLARRTDRWLAGALGTLPVHTADWETWHETAPLNEASRAALSAAEPIPLVVGERDAATIEEMRRRILPYWRALWDGETTPDRFAAAVAAIVIESDPTR